ncbi:HNH endonuclease signature motif containing protein [uncultured Serinicoccus sp.]|uniref:HNH endonuclease signature motif containing protein n=1 Tax=uncultured Serinicoccus sp. TaxID=735514 RepID=UPI0026309970|nr:HNH endonuclease signature motif containing protein [uncultured Serinicoccus sp.]
MERRGGEQPGRGDVWSARSIAAAGPPDWVGAPTWESLSRDDGTDHAARGAGWCHRGWGEDAEGPSGEVDEPLDEIDRLDAVEYAAFMAEVYDALDGRGRDLPARELHGGLAEARAALGRAALSAEETVTVLDDALVEAIESVGRLATQLGAVGFTLAREAAARGLHQDVALSLTDWLRVRCPWLSTQDAAQITDVVRACESPATAAIGDAVASGSVPVHRAALVARTMRRLESSLDTSQQEAYTQIATRAAAQADLSDRDLARVCHQLVEDLLHEAKPGERERAAHELRSVTARRVGPGLTRFTVDAPDGVAATINGVLTSALAAPAPVKDANGHVLEPDTRTPTQRRFDALATTIGRGIGHPGAPPSTARATVLLVIPFDPKRGVPCGPATTATGDYVPPRQAAELGCTADITPVWLAADGAPLALGRESRYASPAQWKALAVRDGGCSFPGCTALPQWCDSHHLDHWARGGRTDVDRMTLLCGRHHTHVHQHDLTATVNGGTLTWHL